MVFRVAAAGDDESAERDREGPVQTKRRSPQFLGIGRAKNGNSDGIGKDDRRVVKLMRGAAQGHAERGSRWDGSIQLSTNGSVNVVYS